VSYDQPSVPSGIDTVGTLISKAPWRRGWSQTIIHASVAW